MSRITVVCIKWGDKYSPKYVNVLHSMVERHLTLPHEFICFTDNPKGIKKNIRTAPIPCDLEGWWTKISLFQSELPGIFTDKILFLDLDVVITGSINGIAGRNSDFCICQDWNLNVEPLLRVNEGRIIYNSSVFLLKIGARIEGWERRPDAERMKRCSDQDWVSECIQGADLWPENWVLSYKAHKLQDGFPEDAKIVVFHGQPKPHECTGWVKDFWK